ncbi:hypothetical protein ULMS_17900 [Patiriisocius marinistellae]|uniref:Uncharacterized protein n=1 Tax=Patiriisocius marinistellae TaxID=2494560 RepID=A0A5J4FYH2_9FLAO|nr:ankyrin repeat domain-containing protein [Patiriisocius marinistellae]GEQ86282.1 hypothetical protein ULMS_17900 [Patiriisocius marinistellae]
MSGGDWKTMFKAIQDNDIELVKMYLRLGMDPNYQHPEVMALPISESIRYNNIAIIELLLANGADLSIIEMESGVTPLKLAENRNNKDIIALINQFVN